MTDDTVHALLDRSVAQHAGRDAVVDGDSRVTYAELDARANQVARALAERGVGVGDRVGLYLNKSIDTVAGLYGVLRAGAAYVPLDPGAPDARLGYIAQNCGLRCLVTAGHKAKSWRGLAEAGAPLEHLLVMDAPAADVAEHAPAGVTLCDADELLGQAPGAPEGAAAGPDDLAYILYTSGSTGVPKGVMLSHRNARGFVDWAVEAVGVRETDRLSSHAPFHFDLSTFDLFAAAASGASVTLVPKKANVFPIELARFMASAEITVWYSVPSVLNMLVERGGLEAGALPDLRTVIFAGEVFPTRHLSRLMGLLPGAAFWNFYGPTETNVCTAYRVPEAPEPDGPDIPIGPPIDCVRGFVVDEAGAEVPAGEVGELLIAGPTVMQGYWGDPEQTAARLVPDPRDGTEPAYRTGDLVTEEPDGNLRYLGRRDNQIKSRGYRIELGDIETAVNSHDAVSESAVVAVPDDIVTNRIVAYVVVTAETKPAELGSHCAARIPSYMVPERFELVDALPRTSTGKIDRQALRARSQGT